MDDLLQEFIAETRETLEALAGEIVAWEAAPADRERLDAIFRFVHTVKGSCGFLDLPRLARLSHAAEDVLATVRDQSRVPDTALVNAVLAIVDRIGEIVEAIDVGAALDDSGEDLLIAALAEGSQIVAPVAAPVTVRAPTRSVRLNVDLLDRMMSGMSDMVLARNELARRLRDDGADPVLEAALERLSLTVAEMRDTVTRTRMQKIDALFSALPRMVRDTAAGVGKSVTLHIEGSDVELDREMIEMMRDPLVHIVRNAIDHGIETPGERRLAGKRETGNLTVSARQSGNHIIVEVIDDGQGIDTARLIAKLVREGRPEAELRTLNEKAALDLVFEPGLSSRDTVSAISGRGVGMDVVRANVEQIGGRIELVNSPGKGLRLTIRVPLTLSIIATIGVAVGDQRFAIPRQTIEEIVTLRGDVIRIDQLGNRPVATVRGRRLAVVDLRTLFAVGDADSTPMLAIVSVPGGSYALAFDMVLDHEELVIKPAAPTVMATGFYAGQTLPDNGMPMLLLDTAGIAAGAGLSFSREPVVEAKDLAVEEPGIAALLFTDLDGLRRLAPLTAIDRVESVSVDNVRYSGGRWRLSSEGQLVPLKTVAEWTGRKMLSVLRLRDGACEIGYGIAEAIDIVTLPATVVPAHSAGPVSGVVLLDDEPVELLDLYWLFAEASATSPAAAMPICLIDSTDTAWMKTFLQPMLEAAGYQVATTLAAGQRPAVVLAGQDAALVADGLAPVLRLRPEVRATAEDGSVYRYDRAGVLAAVGRLVEAAA